MATKKISEFTNLGSLSDNDILPVVSGGSNKKITASVLKTYAQSSIDTGNITFSGDTISSTGEGVDVSSTGYAQISSNNAYVWVENNSTNIEVNGFTWVFDSNGQLTLASNGAGLAWNNPDEPPQPLGGWLSGSTIAFDKDLGIVLSNAVGGAGGFSWILGKDGKLKLPAGGDIVDTNGDSVLGGSVGNPFDQSLNTTDDVAFNSLALSSNITSDGLEIYTNSGSGGSIDLYTDWTGNGTSGGLDLWLVHGDGIFLKTNDGDYVWKFNNAGGLEFPDGTTQTTAQNIAGWTTDVSNHFVPSTDNLQDIGSPTSRVRHIYVGPGSISIGDSVITESTTGKLVLPGVTRATSLFADEVEDTGDQTQTFAPDTEIVVVDAALYAAISTGADDSHFADYTATTDGEGYIDDIQVNGSGTYSQAEADIAKGSMYAYIGSASASDRPINPQDWVQIPFRLRLKANDVEYEFNTEGGGNANTGNVVFEDNILYVGGTGFLNLQTGNGEAAIGTNGPYPLLVSINESDKIWTFNTDGSITFPDSTTQTTAYTGGTGGGVTGLLGSNSDPQADGALSYELTIDADHGSNSIYLRTIQGESGPAFTLGNMSTEGNHGTNAIAIGNDDVGYGQAAGSIAIGYQAGWANDTSIGENSIAIGTRAAYNSSNSNSIVLNASGSDLDATESGLFIKPVREDTNNTVKSMYYNTNSGEVTYADPAGGSSTKTWTTPNSNAWRIEEYSGGWAGGYDYPIAETTYTLVETQTDVNYFFIDSSAYTTEWQAIGWAEEYIINGVTVSAGGYSVTSFPGYNVSLGGNVSYTTGDTVTIRYRNRNASPEAQVWWDAANSNSGNENFRGAIIEYHAYCGNAGTIVGKIIVACDNDMSVSHEEAIMGSNVSQYEFWMQGDTGQLKVRRIGTDANDNDNQIWIQWTGKIFYGSDYYC